MYASDVTCKPRLRQYGKWTFTIFENHRWIEESLSDFSTPEDAMRAGVKQVEQIKRARPAA